MRVFYSPQRSNKKIKYSFEDEKIIAEIDGAIDIFDFTNMPDGKVKVEQIKTKLSVNPIMSAERRKGELYVELINFIDENATEEEKYPDWKEV